MVDAKNLIELNNKKRELLTEENEKYYSDMMIYIRLQLLLSEQQTEEILMELLDHLLEAQNEGKTAKDIFGSNPKQYADEIIQLLPKENTRDWFSFLSPLVLNLLAWMLMIRGIIASFVPDANLIFLFPLFAMLIAIISVILFFIWYIFKVIKDSLFQEQKSKWRDTLKVGLTGAVGGAIVMGISYFTPDIGPTLHLPWYLSVAFGGILWLVAFALKKWKPQRSIL